MGLSCKDIKNACQTRQPHPPLKKYHTHTSRHCIFRKAHTDSLKNTPPFHPSRRGLNEASSCFTGTFCCVRPAGLGFSLRQAQHASAEKLRNSAREKESVLKATMQRWEMSLSCIEKKSWTIQEKPTRKILNNLYCSGLVALEPDEDLVVETCCSMIWFL